MIKNGCDVLCDQAGVGVFEGTNYFFLEDDLLKTFLCKG
jgi:hypothetical protein